mgnify:CR=1 FL=1
MLSLQRSIPLHHGYGVADGSPSHQEGSHDDVRAETTAHRDYRSLQGLDAGDNSDGQRPEAFLPQALPHEQYQLLRLRHGGTHLGLCQRGNRPATQCPVRSRKSSPSCLAFGLSKTWQNFRLN